MIAQSALLVADNAVATHVRISRSGSDVEEFSQPAGTPLDADAESGEVHGAEGLSPDHARDVVGVAQIEGAVAQTISQ